MTSRALITGASGFAGRHLAERLIDTGWTVAGTVHTRSAGLPGLEEHRVELGDRQALTELMHSFRPEIVFHLAAIVDTVTTPDVLELHRVNTLGTVCVLESLRQVVGVRRVLVASSSFAYGRTSQNIQPVKETTPLQPVTAYGASKAASEAIALQWARETAIDVVVTRAFQHTGPGHIGAYALADWAQQLARGRRTLRVGNLEVMRDYSDVRDVAAAYAAVAEHGRAGAIYNVGSGVSRSMRDLLVSLISAFGVEADVEVDESRLRAVDQPVFYADIGRLVADTGWKATYPIDRTLKDLSEWWLDRVGQR